MKSPVLVVVPVSVYLFLLLPFINNIVALDTVLDTVSTYSFYAGGLQGFFLQGDSAIHPPFLPFLISVFWKLLGVSSFTYNILGIFVGTSGIVCSFLIIKKFASVKMAALGATLIAINGLFVANSIAPTNNFFIINFLLAALFFATEKKYFVSILFITLASLIKETALLFSLSYVITTFGSLLLSHEKSIKKYFISLIPHAVPFIVVLIWFAILKDNGISTWHAWNFSTYEDKGSIMTIIQNLITGNVINDYFLINIVFLFIFNWAWLFYTCLLIPSLLFFKVKRKIPSEVIPVLLFVVLNILLVLSFQTFTLPRYGLEATISFILIFFITVNVRQKALFSIAVVSISLIRLFSSTDFVTDKHWPVVYIGTQSMYYKNEFPYMQDSLTYNYQFLLINRERSTMLRSLGNVSKDNSLTVLSRPQDTEMLSITKYR